MAFNCLIVGAAGRDFHDFQTFFHRHPEFRVVAFTAAQIPGIDNRSFPASLAGEGYHADIPIYSETRLPQLIKEHDIDFVFLAYSDLSYEDVMHKASLVQAAGAAFAVLSPRQTQLRSSNPVIAVTAVRTGAGKSPLSQMLALDLSETQGYRVGVIRHPMPYGRLEAQACQKFTRVADLQHFECTIEEREEYEPYLEMGLTVYAGVDYQEILRRADQDSEVILWDGGNNDFSFIRPDLSIVVTDALRAGHEVAYYPGETNLRNADVVVINKIECVDASTLESLRARIKQVNPWAEIVTADLELVCDSPESISAKRVLVVEDGPTLTHGGMPSGAGLLAARLYEAGEIIDPRSAATGSISAAFESYPHIGPVLPALGYSTSQCRELEATINKVGPELIVDASPARLDRVISTSIPIVRIGYRFQQRSGTPLTQLAATTVERRLQDG